MSGLTPYANVIYTPGITHLTYIDSNSSITNVVTVAPTTTLTITAPPVNPTDATNKTYVDGQVLTLTGMTNSQITALSSLV